MNIRKPRDGKSAEASQRTRSTVLPLALLYPPIFVVVYLLHLTLLRLPYFWDEGGYYIPAAWDFWRLGTLIPVSTLTNAHPPLPSVLLAGWWRLTGFHIYSTRLFMCLLTSLALLAVFRLARQVAGDAVAFTVLDLTALYPVWFAQSTLAHADMFAAAATLWALSFYVDRQPWTAAPGDTELSRAISVAACFSLSVLAKETAILTPAALFCFEVIRTVRRDNPHAQSGARRWYMPAALAFPVLPLCAWYAYHRAKTGFTFGNPEYLRYNATANLTAARVALSLWHRLIHLSVHLGMFVPVLTAVVLLARPARRGQRALPRTLLGALGTVVVASWVGYSVLGGALLTRYLLPEYPLILLVCVCVWKRKLRAWPVVAVVSGIAFALACEFNPPYPSAPEDNLAYRDMIVLHQHAIREAEARTSGATILSAWPVTADLQRPELGYVRAPIRTVQVDNFTPDQLRTAAATSHAYGAAIVFSTKLNPHAGHLNLASARTSDARYFDAHQDLRPDQIASMLGGNVLWQEERKGQWAALLKFQAK